MAACLCISVCAVAVVAFLLRGAILNHYVRGAAERAFAKSHPGSTLHLGELRYAFAANRLQAESATLITSSFTLASGPCSITGVRWRHLFWGPTDLADGMRDASLEVTNLTAEFPESHYGIRCQGLRMSVPASELVAGDIEIRTLLGDEEFFATGDFRMTRFHVSVPECRVVGLAYAELLRGKSYHASSVQIFQPVFDALVNRDKPVNPDEKPPMMVHEVLHNIPGPFQINTLIITNGTATYRERVVAGAAPGVLTFASANISVTNIANHGDGSAAIQLQAQSELMTAGTLKLQMSIPIAPKDLSFHYSGSLSAMDMTRLGAFLDIAEHTRIKSGTAHEVLFDIDVSAGRASGPVRAIYNNLVVAVLDKKDGTENGIGNRVASLLVNTLKIEKSNEPDASGAAKEGRASYSKKPDDTFLQFAWFALRSGILDAINQ